MIALELRGLNAFQQGIRDAIANIDQTVSFAYARWTLKVFEDLVMNTPQWSGDTAANWRYSTSSPDGSYQPIIGKGVYWDTENRHAPWDRPDPLQRGDRAAVWAALDRAKDGPAPSWRDKVFFSNNTPIAPDLESNSVYIRPVNLVGGVVAMVSYTRAKWSNLPL